MAHFGAVVLGYLGIIGVMTGRFACGWLCPFGLIQDLLHKIPTPKFKLPFFFNYGRYVILAVLVVLMPLFLVDVRLAWANPGFANSFVLPGPSRAPCRSWSLSPLCGKTSASIS